MQCCITDQNIWGLIVFELGIWLKVEYVICLKRFRKLSLGRVPKQTCSQSVVRGVSTHDMEERVRSVNSQAE